MEEDFKSKKIGDLFNDKEFLAVDGVNTLLRNFIEAIERKTVRNDILTDDVMLLITSNHKDMTLLEFENILGKVRREQNFTKFETVLSIVKKALEDRKKAPIDKKEYALRCIEEGKEMFHKYIQNFISGKWLFVCRETELANDFEWSKFHSFVTEISQTSKFTRHHELFKNNQEMLKKVLRRVQREYEIYYKRYFANNQEWKLWTNHERGWFDRVVLITSVYFFLKNEVA